MDWTVYYTSGGGKTFSDLRRKVKIDEFVFANVLYRYNKRTDNYDRIYRLTDEEVMEWLECYINMV